MWDVSWLKQAYPTHRHIYDYAGIYYTNGDRIIVSEQFKEPQPLGTVAARTNPPAFPGISGRQLRDNDRVTIWELAPAAGPSRPPQARLVERQSVRCPDHSPPFLQPALLIRFSSCGDPAQNFVLETGLQNRLTRRFDFRSGCRNAVR